MSVLRTIAGFFGPSQSIGSGDHWLFRYMGGKTDTGMVVDERLAITLPVVYACISIIADSIAMLPVEVVAESQNALGQRIRIPQADHPTALLLNAAPNKYMTPFTFRQTLLTQTLMRGNGYASLMLNGRGGVEAILPLGAFGAYPFFQQPEADYPDLYYRLWDGTEVPSTQVFHARGMTMDGFVGLSPLAVARNAVAWGLALEKYGNKFFANDTRSGGYLSHPGQLGDKAYERLRESFQERNAGIENAHTVKILEEGMTYTANTIAPDDAQFLGSRDFQVAEIARLYRVPLVLLQSMAKSTSWGSGIEQILLGFVRWTLQPWITQFEQESTLKLLTEAERQQGLRVRVNVDVLLRGDSVARAAWYKAMSDIGALLPNEIRSDEGRNPIPGGDEPRAPSAATSPSNPATTPPGQPAAPTDDNEDN